MHCMAEVGGNNFWIKKLIVATGPDAVIAQ